MFRSALAALGCLLGLAALAGCGAAADARVVKGEQHVGTASSMMKSGGVVFAAYVDPMHGAESSPAFASCLAAVNEAVMKAMAPHVAVTEGSHHRSSRTSMPLWARGLSGPRLAVTVESFRCGDVIGDGGFTRVQPLRTDEPSSARRGEVVLTVHDRNTGAPVVSVVGTATDSDPPTAVRAAARLAAQRLLGLEE